MAHLKNGTFDGVNLRFSRHIQDEDSKRWYFVPIHAKKADISIKDGLEYGQFYDLNFIPNKTNITWSIKFGPFDSVHILWHI